MSDSQDLDHSQITDVHQRYKRQLPFGDFYSSHLSEPEMKCEQARQRRRRILSTPAPWVVLVFFASRRKRRSGARWRKDGTPWDWVSVLRFLLTCLFMNLAGVTPRPSAPRRRAVCHSLTFASVPRVTQRQQRQLGTRNTVSTPRLTSSVSRRVPGPERESYLGPSANWKGTPTRSQGLLACPYLSGPPGHKQKSFRCLNASLPFAALPLLLSLCR